MDMATTTESKLNFTVDGYSSFSATYFPSNIAVDKPKDQSSRWSSGSNNQMQYITLKLDQLSLVRTNQTDLDSITFGKYHKVHVCNLKEFKVYGGMDTKHMTELLHSGLRNDSEPETFALDFKANDLNVPCQYIKIVPLLAWGANFNFSIWYVELRGIEEPRIVQHSLKDYIAFREREAVRLCLKHFRQRNCLDLFEMIQKQTNITLESPVLTELHNELVIKGNFGRGEEIMTNSLHDNLFAEFIKSLSYKPVWKKIVMPDGVQSPCMRGGHQMCMDSEAGIVYLFGGWDGSRDLSDFWAYHEDTGEWRCISMDTRLQGGPEPRSCHKICIDEKAKVIYTLGKYVDPESRPNVPLDGDFWKYDLTLRTWTKISSKTATEGGPDLIYDHQMLIDSDMGLLFVFGGRVISPDPSQMIYSGLYSWNIKENAWRLLRSDRVNNESGVSLKSRIGHSMLLHPQKHELYIFAGQRHKDFLADFYVYNIETDTVTEISRDYSKSGGPEPGFTQRATISSDGDEIYVLSGLMREKNTLSETKNAFWVYSIKRKKWMKVYDNENSGTEYWTVMGNQEPQPRFAHQMVYNTNRKCQYLFGGNPGDSSQPNLRLDDFWELTLVRPSAYDILRKAHFQIRRQHFVELTQSKKSEALEYLQNGVAKVVNHNDTEESQAFRELALYLFSWKSSPLQVTEPQNECGMVVDEDQAQLQNELFNTRTKLYETLVEYFPYAMKEPKSNLVDLVTLKN